MPLALTILIILSQIKNQSTSLMDTYTRKICLIINYIQEHKLVPITITKAMIEEVTILYYIARRKTKQIYGEKLISQCGNCMAYNSKVMPYNPFKITNLVTATTDGQFHCIRGIGLIVCKKLRQKKIQNNTTTTKDEQFNHPTSPCKVLFFQTKTSS